MTATAIPAPTTDPSRRTVRSLQTPSAVVMIRPHHFAVNAQTAADNVFQSDTAGRVAEEVAAAAYAESTALADALSAHGVTVHLFDDDATDRPDGVFPNNWFSTHRGGRIVTYPMYTVNRRRERRADVIELLKEQYRVQDVIDYSGLEHDGLFLEGTGAMVLDHAGLVAYVARSRRADPVILERFCTHTSFEPMVFDAADAHGTAIYHTNVLMCVGTDFALVCLDAITDPRRRAEVADRLTAAGRSMIDLTQQQLLDFAGNAFELTGTNGQLLAMSGRAHRALRSEQIDVIERSATIVSVEIPTIELAGGSVRCMLGGVHLDARPHRPPHRAGGLHGTARGRHRT
jgi:hypothetical protein